MQKPNLVLVHSFPTNSILFHGLKEFLDDYFVVYFIDLPGFHPDSPPCETISLLGYSGFVARTIDSLGLTEYWLAGISFGFLVVQGVVPKSGCKGIVAIEPFTGVHSMRMGFWTKTLSKCFVGFVCAFGLHEAIFRSRIFKTFLCFNEPSERINTMLRTFDSFTFFETAKLLLNHKVAPSLCDLPYVLAINPTDTTIDAERTISLFIEQPKICVLHTTSDHYPTSISKEYFERTIQRADVERMLSFINEVCV